MEKEKDIRNSYKIEIFCLYKVGLSGPIKILTNRNVCEHFAFASIIFAVNLLRFHIVKIMLFEPMSAEALRCGADGFAILAVGIPPMHIQSISSRFSHFCFVCFEFLFGHHLSTIVHANNIIVFNIGINMLPRISIHNNSIHHCCKKIFLNLIKEWKIENG